MVGLARRGRRKSRRTADAGRKPRGGVDRTAERGARARAEADHRRRGAQARARRRTATEEVRPGTFVSATRTAAARRSAAAIRCRGSTRRPAGSVTPQPRPSAADGGSAAPTAHRGAVARAFCGPAATDPRARGQVRWRRGIGSRPTDPPDAALVPMRHRRPAPVGPARSTTASPTLLGRAHALGTAGGNPQPILARSWTTPLPGHARGPYRHPCPEGPTRQPGPQARSVSSGAVEAASRRFVRAFSFPVTGGCLRSGRRPPPGPPHPAGAPPPADRRSRSG
jgi:hypothetical protein